MPTPKEILAALKAYHTGTDWLLARMVILDRDFLPSKSPYWPAMVEGNRVIKLLEDELKAKTGA